MKVSSSTKLVKTSNTSLAKSSGLGAARSALVKAGRGGELPGYVTRDEVARALELLRQDGKNRLALFLDFLWLSGARVSEALAVRVCDVDFRAGLVTVKILKRRAPETRNLPVRPAWLGFVAVAINLTGLKSDDRLFPWSRSRAFELVRDALLAAGVERHRAHPHAIRHGHAIFALEQGAPLNVVQRALGHASLTTTSIYLRVTAQDVRRFYDEMPW